MLVVAICRASVLVAGSVFRGLDRYGVGGGFAGGWRYADPIDRTEVAKRVAPVGGRLRLQFVLPHPLRRAQGFLPCLWGL